MGWKNSKDWKKCHERRSKRYGELGRKFEQEEMRYILQKMVDDRELSCFEIFPPNSEHDRNGKDVDVGKEIDSTYQHRTFGVTISMRSWKEAQMRHPDVPQFCFPIGTKPETIRKRILRLFSKAP